MKHTKTDPACAKHQPPKTAWARWLFDRGRGKSCRACFPNPYRSQA